MNKSFTQKSKVSKSYLTAVLFLAMLCLVSSVTIDQSQVSVHSKKQFAFDAPPVIYSGIPNNQLVSIDYSKYVPSGAQRACFII
jgi:hypothetical protein